MAPPGTTAQSYELPWFYPAPEETPSNATAPTQDVPSAPAELVPCLTEAKAGPACKTALEKMAASGVAIRVVDTYRRGCELGVKFLACGVFLSQAISEADEPVIERLALCEGGRYEACEDVKTSSPPLIAWLTSLKQRGCRAGASALCPDYHACKPPALWGCRQVSGSLIKEPGCGCVPKCSGDIDVRLTGRDWPDRTPRATFKCIAPPPR
jgi:hypothetical protein